MHERFKKNLTVIILCGGKGKRLYPLTKYKPKPLIKIQKKEILRFIIDHLKGYGLNDIRLATGYKHSYFKLFLQNDKKLSNLKAINSGVNSDILKRIIDCSRSSNKYIMVCYGDTLVDININKLINLFIKDKRKIILSSYNFKSQFGLMKIGRNSNVLSFEEKPNLGLYFNIGFFLFKKEKINFLKKFNNWQNFLENKKTKKYLKAYIHKGKHITVNTIHELDEAQKNLKNYFK